MLRFLFIGCFLLFSSTIAWQIPLKTVERSYLIMKKTIGLIPVVPMEYNEIQLLLTWKLNLMRSIEIYHLPFKKFLKELQQEDSRISNIRIFRAPGKEGYAVTSSYLFQNFLSGKVLVELYCVVRIMILLSFI